MVHGPLAGVAIRGESGADARLGGTRRRLPIGGREGEVEVLGRRTSTIEKVCPIPDLRATFIALDRVGDDREDRLVEAGRVLERAGAEPEVVDDPGVAALAVVDGFDAVARVIEDERAIVVGPVLGPRPGGTVAVVARVSELAPPGVDGFR